MSVRALLRLAFWRVLLRVINRLPFPVPAKVRVEVEWNDDDAYLAVVGDFWDRTQPAETVEPRQYGWACAHYSITGSGFGKPTTQCGCDMTPLTSERTTR